MGVWGTSSGGPPGGTGPSPADCWEGILIHRGGLSLRALRPAFCPLGRLPAAPLAFSFPYGQVSLEDQGPARYGGHNAYAITPGLSLVPCKPVPHPAPPSLLPSPREISAFVLLGAGGPGSVGALGSGELRDLPVDFPAVSRFKPQF